MTFPRCWYTLPSFRGPRGRGNLCMPAYPVPAEFCLLDTWGICTRRAGKLWRARLRLYRSRFLHPNTHFSAFFENYKTADENFSKSKQCLTMSINVLQISRDNIPRSFHQDMCKYKTRIICKKCKHLLYICKFKIFWKRKRTWKTLPIFWYISWIRNGVKMCTSCRWY